MHIKSPAFNLLESLDEYQSAAMSTAIYPKDSEYAVLGLVSETGEVAGKIAKQIRDHTDIETLRQDLLLELGDILYGIAAVADKYDLRLSDIASLNMAKLADRKRRGVLGGSGDKR